uniref:SCP domain-containing protein n=1 Tax=Ditylenchus dipsaci TaxID=166011 RepID=A0A915DEF6_9BILA
MLLYIMVVGSYFVAGASGLTAAQKSIALDSHNNYRSQLARGQSVDNKNATMPQGKNIYQLIYNQTLENSAQLWSNNCTWKHSGAGENMFAYSTNISSEKALSDASNWWWAELAQYGMNRELIFTQAEFDKTVGHWSQMAWGRTTQLGCGVTWCPNGAPPLTWRTTTIVVCHYREYGNYFNQKVYEAGSPCTKNTDCTTFPNSVCNVNMGLCSTVPLSSAVVSTAPGGPVATTARASLPASSTRPATTTTSAKPTTTTLKLATTAKSSTISPLTSSTRPATATTSAKPASSTIRPMTTAMPQSTPLTAAQRRIALDSHNNYRSQLAKGQSVDNNNVTMPQGKNIYQLTYDQTLEESAQSRANNCSYYIIAKAGENVFAYGPKASFETVLTAATKSWWSQLARLGMNRQLNYTLAESYKTVRNWSQMAWGKTTLLGCAMTWCPNGAPPLNWPTATILICHYKEVGNFFNQLVYEAGGPCTKNADCTTYVKSSCNVTMGLCSTTA